MLTDTLPAGTTFNWALANNTPCPESGGVVACTIANGASVVVRVSVQLSAGLVGSFIDNIASVTSATVDPDNSNNSVTEETEVVGFVAAVPGVTAWALIAAAVALDGAVYWRTRHRSRPSFR